MARKSRNTRKKTSWERGYQGSHCLWQGRDKLAMVRLERDGSLKYVWQAAGRMGAAATLAAAKSAAESAVLHADRQLPLFTTDEDPPPAA